MPCNLYARVTKRRGISHRVVQLCIMIALLLMMGGCGSWQNQAKGKLDATNAVALVVWGIIQAQQAAVGNIPDAEMKAGAAAFEQVAAAYAVGMQAIADGNQAQADAAVARMLVPAATLGRIKVQYCPFMDGTMDKKKEIKDG